MPAVKILVADAQYLIRVGLINLISSNERFKVVGDATCSQELKSLTAKHKPDVVILDYNQPKHFKLEDLAEVKKVSPKSHILIISSDETRENIYKALDFGGISFLTKECDQEEIINAIIATAKGEKFICHKIIDIILDKHQSKDSEDCKPFNLSLREIEIIQMTAKGLPAKEIARQLYLSTHTVYTHKKNIMKKLKLNSSSEMMLYAINNGLTIES